MNHPAYNIPLQDAVSHNPTQQRRSRGMLIVSLVVGVLGIALLAANRKIYMPGDNFGYYLGMVGGIMMSLLLLYPLRKHVRFLQPLGNMRHWFKFHMVLGVVGPTLVIIHSAFGIGSLNAAVAMFCMLLVAGSGVIGRFIYARIHHGLYGRKASLDEMRAKLGIHTTEVRSKFHFVPSVEERLKVYHEQAEKRSPNFFSGVWKFMTLAVRARACRWNCRRELRKSLVHHAAQRKWDRAKFRHRLASADEMVRAYLESVRHTAQFRAYERMFSLWHIAHVPFVFMLVISGIVHVVAVHMY